MLVIDRIRCDCCGDDMGQLLGGECTTPGAIVDLGKAPHFAVCPDCYGDAAEYLGLVPVVRQIGAGQVQPAGENGTKQDAF